MKISRFIHFALFGLLIPFAFSTCTSDGSPCEQITGGFGQLYNTYVFWMGDNYGQMIVEVKDSKGVLQQADNDLISQYYPMKVNPATDCSSSGKQNNAVFQLAPGTKYSFRAYNSNHNFTGSLDLTCDGGQCLYINISPK